MSTPTNLYNRQKNNNVKKFQTQTTQATTEQLGTQISDTQQGNHKMNRETQQTHNSLVKRFDLL